MLLSRWIMKRQVPETEIVTSSADRLALGEEGRTFRFKYCLLYRSCLLERNTFSPTRTYTEKQRSTHSVAMVINPHIPGAPSTWYVCAWAYTHTVGIMIVFRKELKVSHCWHWCSLFLPSWVIPYLFAFSFIPRSELFNNLVKQIRQYFCLALSGEVDRSLLCPQEAQFIFFLLLKLGPACHYCWVGWDLEQYCFML